MHFILQAYLGYVTGQLEWLIVCFVASSNNQSKIATEHATFATGIQIQTHTLIKFNGYVECVFALNFYEWNNIYKKKIVVD